MKWILFVTLLTAFAAGNAQSGNAQTANEQKSWSSNLVSSWKPSSWKRIFSIRPQEKTPVVALIQLRTPSLLEGLEPTNNSEIQIDDKRALAIEKEQSELIAEIQKLTGDFQILFKYRLVLNGIAVIVPREVYEKLKALPNVSLTENASSFSRPKTWVATSKGSQVTRLEETSVKFIQGLQAHALGLKGKNIKVGVIDTGVDYTHQMFGGEGSVEAYKAIDPALPTAAFPNAKVIGGIDFVGKDFDASSPDFKKRIPYPDQNPIDEAGHGTHVAGTIAGIGDGVLTYDGVAPEALLYAIKVFGEDGSTSDEVVIASLEYAMDPNGDLKFDDRLDVVNMSLGSSFGSPHILYNLAIKNLVRGGGVIVVASSGNSGNQDYITGAPGTSDDTISVAASIDNMLHNWNFRAVEFLISGESVTVEAIESTIALSIEEAGDVQGELVHLGTAAEDLTPEQIESVKGKVAFIDRGVVTFAEKIKRSAEAGAVGVVVANNTPGAPLAMGGGNEKFQIPAIMITLELAQKIKASESPAVINFNTPLKISKPELIDTLTGFSSKGPRSSDGFIKPDISAPGQGIISAEVGTGKNGNRLSGTSMAAPHVAGVAALLKESRPDLTAREIQSMMMGSAKMLSGEFQLISRQGAGRVQIMNALQSQIVTDPMSVSLGEQQIDGYKALSRKVLMKNISPETLSLEVSFQGHKALNMPPAQLSLSANEARELPLLFQLNGKLLSEAHTEVDGMLVIKSEGVQIHQIPVLLVAHKVSAVRSVSAEVEASKLASAGASVKLTLSNSSGAQGEALVFNLLGLDGRKKDDHQNSDQIPYRNRECDLQAAGYRIIEKEVAGKKTAVLQFAAKIFEPMTTWNPCEVIVEIDGNGDGISDQELAGVPQDRIKPLASTAFASILMDAGVARNLRKEFEQAVFAGEKDPAENYESALLGMLPMTLFKYSTISVVEVEVSQLDLLSTGELSVKLATTHTDTGAVQMDDYLGGEAAWKKISINPLAHAFYGMGDSVALAPGETREVSLTKGFGKEGLLLLYPANQILRGSFGLDQQMEMPRVNYVKQH